MTTLPTVTIYQDPETDLFSIRVDADELNGWDDLADLTEQEAIDEADAIAAEIGATIIRA